MAFWHKIFKKETEGKNAEEKQTADVSDSDRDAINTAERSISAAGAKAMPGVLRSPRTTEKTTDAAKENKYVFIVAPQANKISVARAVESKYSVGVSAVRILNMPPKERRRGKQIGWRQGFKKAMVTVKEGQKIEIQ